MTTATAALGRYRIPESRETWIHEDILKALGLTLASARFDANGKPLGEWHTDDEQAYSDAMFALTGQRPGPMTGDGSGTDTGDGPAPQGAEGLETDGTPSQGESQANEQAPKDAEDLNDRQCNAALKMAKDATGQAMGDVARMSTDTKRQRLRTMLPDDGQRQAVVAAVLAAMPGKTGAPKASGNGQAQQAGAGAEQAQGDPQEGEVQAPQDQAREQAMKDANQVFGPMGLAAIVAIVDNSPGQVDEDVVRRIAREEDAKVLELTAEMGRKLAAGLESLAKNGVAAEGASRAVTEVVFKAPLVPEGVSSKGMHFQAPLVAALLLQGANVGLVGKPGIGKTHLAKDVGTLTGWGFAGSVSCTADMTSAAFFGRLLPIGKGRYLPVSFTLAFENGGVFLADEADAMPGEIAIGINGALANGYLYLENRTIAGLSPRLERNGQFGFLCGMNTFGTGATAEYSARQGLDAATRDRLILLEMEADQRVVAGLFGASRPKGARAVWTPDQTPFDQAERDAWYAWYLKVGSTLQQAQKRVVWSPRVGQKVTQMRQAGMSRADVVQVLFAGWKADTVAALGALQHGPFGQQAGA